MSVKTTSPKEFFSKHARDYAKSESHAHGLDLTRLIELLEPKPNEIVLDIATGTGFTAMELAPKVKQVIATDITKEMLDEAERLSKEKKLSNIRFEKAEASKLPFLDSSFGIVATRRAAHHFNNVPKFLREANRVLKPSGQLGIVDMSPPEGTQQFFNRIEIFRDSTHTRAWTPNEWKHLVEDSGLLITHLEILGENVTFERWLYPVKMGGKEEADIRKEWEKASPKIRETLGFEQDSHGQVQSWIKNRIILIAKKLH